MRKEMKKGTKIGLLCFFLPCEIFIALVTIPALFICPPVGIVGAIHSVFFGIVVISIIQSIRGKKPIFNLFREGEKPVRNAVTHTKNRSHIPVLSVRKEKEKNIRNMIQ